MTYHQIATNAGIELNPNNIATHSIIWLHGLGADGNDFVPIVPALNLPSTISVRFIFPHAPIMPITINNGYEMRAWYDIAHTHLDRKYDEDGIATSQMLINALLSDEEARGIPAKNIILAGFSQGAVMALTTGLCYQKKIGGIIALSGYLPMPDQILHTATIANRSTPIFMAHGSQDPMVPVSLGETAKNILQQAGYQITWRSYPMPHTVATEEIQDISTWIQSVWK